MSRNTNLLLLHLLNINNTLNYSKFLLSDKNTVKQFQFSLDFEIIHIVSK